MRWRGGEEPWGRGAKRRAERASPKPFLTPYTICSFGQVFKGTYRGMVVAVKTMNVVEQDSLERFRAAAGPRPRLQDVSSHIRTSATERTRGSRPPRPARETFARPAINKAAREAASPRAGSTGPPKRRRHGRHLLPRAPLRAFDHGDVRGLRRGQGVDAQGVTAATQQAVGDVQDRRVPLVREARPVRRRAESRRAIHGVRRGDGRDDRGSRKGPARPPRLGAQLRDARRRFRVRPLALR